MKTTKRFLCPLLTGLAGALLCAPVLALETEDMLDMSLEQLMAVDVEITSASRSVEKAFDSANAVFVITAEDIRRSAASSVPEVLRMVPGLHVAQINSSEWAVASRGFNGQYSRYLLVMINGRSIYSPLFSGVHWNEHNLIMDEIERIEVIRGAGGSLWGANALNGVINIITRAPAPGQSQLTVQAGNGGHALTHGAWSARTEDLSYRVAAQYGRTDGLDNSTSELNESEWHQARVSSTAQWTMGQTEAEAYLDLARISSSPLWPEYNPGQVGLTLFTDEEHKDHFSTLGRFRHPLGEGDRLEASLSAAQTRRDSDSYQWDFASYDIDLGWIRSADARELQLGLNYRFSVSEFSSPRRSVVALDPARAEISFLALYGQYQAELSRSLQLTLGTRVEDHSGSAVNVQPSVRLMWQPDPSHRVWLALSRAVSNPSLILENSTMYWATVPFDELPAEVQTGMTMVGLAGLPMAINSAGEPGQDLKTVRLHALDLGYRYRMGDRFTLDLATFWYDYDNLLNIKAGRSTPVPTPDLSVFPPVLPTYVDHVLYYDDLGAARSWGGELSLQWRVTPDWQLQFGSSYMEMTPEHPISEFGDYANRAAIVESVPKGQYSIRSQWHLNERLSLDLWVFHYGEMKESGIDAFTSTNARIEWRPNPSLQLSLVGKNLIDPHRTEFYGEAIYVGDFRTERSVFAELRWNFD